MDFPSNRLDPVDPDPLSLPDFPDDDFFDDFLDITDPVELTFELVDLDPNSNDCESLSPIAVDLKGFGAIEGSLSWGFSLIEDPFEPDLSETAGYYLIIEIIQALNVSTVAS